MLVATHLCSKQGPAQPADGARQQQPAPQGPKRFRSSCHAVSTCADSQSSNTPAAFCYLPFSFSNTIPVVPLFLGLCCFPRLHQLSSQLSARESELDKLHEQLQQEVAAAAHKAAAQQAELSGERSLLSKQCASLDQERETFKAWLAERKEELARQHKVGGAGRSVLYRRVIEGHCLRMNDWLVCAHSHYRRDGASFIGTLHSCAFLYRSSPC